MMSILAAAVAATEEAVRAEAGSARRAAQIDQAEVAALVATLPARAAEGKAGDASAVVFLFAEWDPRDHHAAEVAGAAKEQLAGLGLSPVVEAVKVGLREVPGRLVVDYADLREAAQKEATSRGRWIEAARAIWAKVGGEGADLQLVTTASGKPLARFTTRALAVPVNDATPFRMDFLLRTREREFEVEAFWLCDIGETVAMVERQIRPVRWAIPAIEAAWQALGGGGVSFSYGLYDGGSLRQVTVVEFRRGLQTLKYAVEDVHSLSAEELAERASLDRAWQADPASEAPALADRAPAHTVAGAARDAYLGIDRKQKDSFVHVPVTLPAAPDPPKGPEALTVPVAGDGEIDPTRMTPGQAISFAGQQRERAAKKEPPSKKAEAPGAGRHRKASVP